MKEKKEAEKKALEEQEQKLK